MMVSDITQARRVYECFPAHLKSPYHHPDYVDLDASEKENAKALFFCYGKSGEYYYHPIHLIHTPFFNVFDFESARGYGGGISTSMDSSFLNEVKQAYIDFSMENKACVEFIRFSPMLNNQTYYFGEYWFDRSTCAIDLSNYDLRKINHGSMGKVSKAKKSGCNILFTCSPTADQVECFESIYNQRMSDLLASEQYIFSSDYFKSLFFNGNEVAFALRNDMPVAASIFLKGGSFIEYHLSAATDEGRRCGATNLILHEASLRYKDEAGALHLGGGTDANPENTLLIFKQGMAGLDKRFFIGKYIHNKEQYEVLGNSVPNNSRVIFYR